MTRLLNESDVIAVLERANPASPAKGRDWNILSLERISKGRLGTSIAPNQPIGMLKTLQIDMIERRILRIEAALKLAGIHVDALPLPE